MTELEFLEKIKYEVDTAGYGEGYSLNLYCLSRMLNKRIEQVKNCSVPLVSVSLDLEKLAKQVDEALAKETPESLTKWLNERRQNAKTDRRAMQYLITTSDGESPYFTNWYTHENCFNMKSGMVVYDLVNRKYTHDGTQWQPIDEDHL